MKNIAELVVITKSQAIALEAAKLIPFFRNVETMIAAQEETVNGWSDEYAALNGMESEVLKRALKEGYTTNIQVKQITVTRGEGPSHECRIPHYAKTWNEANAILKKMAISAPSKGGYDKTDFVIEFNNGDIYSGTYDLKGHDQILGDLYRHVKNFCEFYAGKCNPLPAHIKSDETYRSIIGEHTQSYLQFLENVLYPSAELQES